MSAGQLPLVGKVDFNGSTLCSNIVLPPRGRNDIAKRWAGLGSERDQGAHRRDFTSQGEGYFSGLYVQADRFGTTQEVTLASDGDQKADIVERGHERGEDRPRGAQRPPGGSILFRIS